MNKEEYREILNKIYNTEDEEIDCGAVYDAVARFVDMEISGADAAAMLPLVHQHLEECPPCYDLYDALHAIAELEAEGRLDEIPTTLAALFSPPAPDSPGLDARV